MMPLVPLLVVLCAVTQVFSEEIGPKEELDYWTSNQIQDGWLAPDPFREILRRMTRKPRPQQFIGLMGGAPPVSRDPYPRHHAQITRKRHKINSFVGLMGKRNTEDPDSYEWSSRHDYEQRRRRR
ncbi:protachykinin-like [Gadus chalcogrammus]|uniref:protachykinin-like n=1 Tax=Gadus chalcogrammus TaxID=1042646 RepID=UPI0024C49CB5|nr:protachykinin-like [Gadus chalcogrammus]